MGLFSSKKKTYVSSSVWNMAGDIKDRANYLKTTVVGNILLDSPKSLGEAIPNTYLNGPGMGLKRYAKWAKGPSGYDDSVGYVSGGLSFGDSLDPEVLKSVLPKGADEYLLLNEYDIGLADSDWWAEEYMVNNHQDLLFTDWFSELDETTGSITITFADTTTTSFTPVGFNSQGRYLYALYQAISGGVTGPITPGTVQTASTEADFPAVPSEMYLYKTEDVLTPVDFDKMVVVDAVYSDGRPSEHTETPSVVAGSLVNQVTTYHKYALVDYDSSTRDLYVQERKDKKVPGTAVVTEVVEDLGGGVTKTVTTTTTVETVAKEFLYHFDVQTVANDLVSQYRYYRYAEGSGNASLDAMFKIPEATGQYLPYIPIRINNRFIKDFSPELYRKTKRAYYKAMAGGDLNKVVRKIADNPQLGDLDFVYAVYGTSLNAPEQTAREYMYRFFDKMASNSPGSYTQFDQWENQWALAAASMDEYEKWADDYSPGSSSTPPKIIPYPELPVISLDMRSTTGWMNFHMAVQMNGTKKSSGAGLRAGHKKGDYWFETRPTKIYLKKFVNFSNRGSGSGSSSPQYQGTFAYRITVEHLVVYHQVSDTNWESVELFGLVHKNYVYDGKWVVIKGSEAMNDAEESGFIIPLHEETFKEMRLVDATQLATACCYLVFNCYKTVKKKWYQSGFFKILLVVVIIVVSIVFAPAGAGATGVLGSSAAVGAAAGFTGTAAIVAGTIANALAAMIITKALTAAFGDKLGPILGSVVTIALTAYGGIGGDFSNFDAGSLMTELGKANNLISLTDGLVKSVSAFMNEKTMKIMEETQRMMEQYKQDMLEVAKQYEEMFGGKTHGVIDPLLYTNAGYSGSGESRGAYIERTLMCGGDIAEMTQSLITNFTKTTLSLELPS